MKWFLPNYVHFNGLKLSGALEEFSITSQFLGSKMQKIIFSRKYAVWGQILSNWSTGDYKPNSRLEKTQSTWTIAFDRFLYEFYHVSRFV